MSYHNEVQIGIHIFRIINKHMDEADGCRHNIRQIMKEAMKLEGQQGLEGENFQSNNTSQSAGEPIDIASNRQSAN